MNSRFIRVADRNVTGSHETFRSQLLNTVSTVLNRPESVPESTRAKVMVAIEELGYVRGGARGSWRRTGDGLRPTTSMSAT